MTLAKALARQSIQSGGPLILRIRGESTYNPATGESVKATPVDTNFIGLLAEIKFEMIDGRDFMRGDQRVRIDADQIGALVPLPGHHVVQDSVENTIVSVTKQRREGSVVSYLCQIRHSGA